ncbi:hypothetical protein CMV_019452 [Castanea mollissima]|uniref:Phospholipase-like protein n=1 Tax=Castanea mollissima TaxID=60419 RepID=A0A8J4VEJ3_9ROSI|nr:hypothetical protein CMV_019452 [Castanea mollissima]
MVLVKRDTRKTKQESSGEEYMVSPKVSRRANWSSIPSRRSARIKSINSEQEKSNNIWKDSEADSDNQAEMKGLKVKLPMRKGSETPKAFGKRKRRNMHSNNSPIFLGERAVSPRGSNVAILNQETVSPDNEIQGNKEAEGAIDDEAGVTRKDIEVQTSRNIATEACENSPAMFTSMASEQNVHGAEVVSPDNHPQGYNDGQGDYFSCNGINASLFENSSTSLESSSSDDTYVDLAGERSIILANQELKGALEKTFETHIPEETADGAGANAAAILTIIPSEQDVRDAAVVSLDTALEGDNEGMGTYSPDRVSCKSLAPSLFHMTSTFYDISSDATSSVDNTLEQVGSYCVSAECAPTLLAIIEKYGDIARNCTLESPKMINYLLEKVCTAVLDLQKIPFSKLKKHHLASVKDVIVLADAARLDVEWLCDHHDEIREIIVGNIPYYKDLKTDLANSTELLKLKKTSLDNKKLERLKLQAELRMLECEIENEECQLQRITKTVEELKEEKCKVQSKLQQYHCRSAGHGLLKK